MKWPKIIVRRQATNLQSALEHRDPTACTQEVKRSGQPGNPAPKNTHVRRLGSCDGVRHFTALYFAAIRMTPKQMTMMAIHLFRERCSPSKSLERIATRMKLVLN